MSPKNLPYNANKAEHFFHASTCSNLCWSCCEASSPGCRATPFCAPSLCLIQQWCFDCPSPCNHCAKLQAELSSCRAECTTLGQQLAATVASQAVAQRELRAVASARHEEAVSRNAIQRELAQVRTQGCAAF